VPNMPKLNKSAVTLIAAKPRFLNIRKLSIGAVARSSHRMNAASKTAPITKEGEHARTGPTTGVPAHEAEHYAEEAATDEECSPDVQTALGPT